MSPEELLGIGTGDGTAGTSARVRAALEGAGVGLGGNCRRLRREAIEPSGLEAILGVERTGRTWEGAVG